VLRPVTEQTCIGLIQIRRFAPEWWSNLQTGFVDEPRQTVEGADKLVAAVMQRLAEGFANEPRSSASVTAATGQFFCPGRST
jgi:hypothetical protein